MRLNLILIVAMGYCMLICKPALSQNNSAGIDKALTFPSSFFNKINQTTEKLDTRLTRQTERYLQRLAKREKIYNVNTLRSTAPAGNNCSRAAGNNTSNLRTKFKGQQASPMERFGVNTCPVWNKNLKS